MAIDEFKVLLYLISRCQTQEGTHLASLATKVIGHDSKGMTFYVQGSKAKWGGLNEVNETQIHAEMLNCQWRQICVDTYIRTHSHVLMYIYGERGCHDPILGSMTGK